MKIKLLPILSIAAALFFSSSLSAQRNIDWSVEEIVVPPSKFQTVSTQPASTEITLMYVAKNNGPDTAQIGDSIFHLFRFNIVINGQQQTVWYPAAFTITNSGLGGINKTLEPGDTIHVRFPAVTAPYAITGNSANINVTVLSELLNRGNDSIKRESGNSAENNSKVSQVPWLVLGGWGVNVTTVDLDGGFNIYPNPSTGEFTLTSLVKNAVEKENKIKVYDVNGRVVFTTQVDVMSNEQKLDLSHLNNGIYFVEYSNGLSLSTTKVSIAK